MENNGVISNKALENHITDAYNIEKYGAVIAIHLYLNDLHSPMADLAFAFGGAVAGVRWDDINERKKYIEGINSYTVVYDDRFRSRDFESWITKAES